MQVAIAGASGFIGSALRRALAERGDTVRPLLRPSSPPDPDGIRWDPAGGVVQTELLEGVDAVVNLAGESIGAARWTASFKKRIAGSRIRSTQVLADAVASLSRKPKVFVGASASGYYGERGEDVVTETTPAGSGFLSDLCVRWEEAASRAGVRTVVTRSAIVLGRGGGLLAKMALPFKLGVGGKLGDGKQWMPWIALEDQVRAIIHLIDDDVAAGAFNLCAPTPVRNEEFTHELGRAVRRPTFMTVPSFALRAAFGREATEQAFLVSQRMVSSRLADHGFDFRVPTIREALERSV